MPTPFPQTQPLEGRALRLAHHGRERVGALAVEVFQPPTVIGKGITQSKSVFHWPGTGAFGLTLTVMEGRVYASVQPAGPQAHALLLALASVYGTPSELYQDRLPSMQQADLTAVWMGDATGRAIVEDQLAHHARGAKSEPVDFGTCLAEAEAALKT
jgi:hypothetical protein